MTRRHLAVVLALSTTLALGACGSDDDDDNDDNAAPRPTTTSSAAGGDVCAAMKAEGATGASFGPIQIGGTADQMEDAVDEALDVLDDDITPPAEIADAWKTRVAYLERLEGVLDPMDDNAMAADPQLIGTAEENAADKALTDYWFATCG